MSETLSLADVKKVWDKVFGKEYTIESFDYLRKKHGIRYTVEYKGDGSWTCSCQSFLFKSGTIDIRIEDSLGERILRDTCKHIRFILACEKIAFEENI